MHACTRVHVHTHTYVHIYTFMKNLQRKPYLQLAAVVWLILKVNLNSFKNHWNLGLHYRNSKPLPWGEEIVWLCDFPWNIIKMKFQGWYPQLQVCEILSPALEQNKSWSPGSVMVYFLHEVPQQKGAPPSQRDGTRQKEDWDRLWRCFYILKSELVWSHSITFTQSTHAFISMFKIKDALAGWGSTALRGNYYTEEVHKTFRILFCWCVFITLYIEN